MKVTLDIPDYELEQEVTIAFRDVLPFVATVVRAEALISSMPRDQMIRFTSSQASLQGVILLQKAIEGLMHPMREITPPEEARDDLL
jgi:hypothetical protein